MSRLQVSSVSSIMSLLLQFLLLSAIAITTISHAQECAPNGDCDTHPRCPFWKEEGECRKSPGYMKQYCPVSCGYVEAPVEKTPEEIVEASARFGKKQEAVGAEKEETLEVILRSIEYMKQPRDVHSCKNEHEHCSFWTAIGELLHVLRWMKYLTGCALSLPSIFIHWIGNLCSICSLQDGVSHMFFFFVQ